MNSPKPLATLSGVFRPCIDLHQGKVKQLVGGTLKEDGSAQTNYVSDRPASWYAALYRRDGLRGGHVIMLGPGNEAAAREALAAYPGGLQLGGGVRPENAGTWLDAGASHVIATSYLFPEGRLSLPRLEALARAAGKERVVVDLSCRKTAQGWQVAINRWRTLTDTILSRELLETLAPHCAEFLVHAVDREGLCRGIDLELARFLAEVSPLPVTYAGGARSLEDLERITEISQGRVDLTIGSALDIFGGSGVRYADCVAFNRRIAARPGRSEA